MGGSLKKTARAIALCSLLAMVFLAYCNFLDDPDLWWHLKTGESIYLNHALPTKDHFSFTSETPDFLKNMGRGENTAVKLPSDYTHWSTNLTHSWLGELLFYLAYLAGGFIGVALLKSAVFVSALLLLYRVMRRNGSGFFLSFSIVALICVLGTDFNLSRPQVFSFLFMVAMVYLLSDYRRGGRKFYLLPPMMLLWANLHAGFVVGVVSLAAFAAGETAKFVVAGMRGKGGKTERGDGRLKGLLLVALATFLAGLVNPNGFKIFLMAVEAKSSLFAICISEYAKPALYGNRCFWLLVLLWVVFVLISIRKMEIAEILFVLSLLAGSLSAQRMTIFFALGAAAFLAKAMSAAGSRIAARNRFKKFTDNPVFNGRPPSAPWRSRRPSWRHFCFSPPGAAAGSPVSSSCFVTLPKPFGLFKKTVFPITCSTSSTGAAISSGRCRSIRCSSTEDASTKRLFSTIC